MRINLLLKITNKWIYSWGNKVCQKLQFPVVWMNCFCLWKNYIFVTRRTQRMATFSLPVLLLTHPCCFYFRMAINTSLMPWALAASLTTDYTDQHAIFTETYRKNLRCKYVRRGNENNVCYSLCWHKDIQCCLLIRHKVFPMCLQQKQQYSTKFKLLSVSGRCWICHYSISFIAPVSYYVDQMAKVHFYSYSPWIKLHCW